MLSIIIPTLNEENYLPKLLESIKKQSFRDYEIIVADAGSKDKTKDIAKSYNCIIVQGGLPAKGRNNGAKVAKGNVLLFLDSDTTLSDGFLVKSVAEFKKRNLGVAGFWAKTIDGEIIDRLLYFLFNVWMSVSESFFHWSAVAIMSDKKVHDAAGGFDEDVLFEEDLLYSTKAAKIAKYGFIKQPFFVSIRRYKRDGRFTYIKYVLAAFYTLFWKPVRSDLFNYKFNHYKSENPKSKSQASK